MGELQPVKEEKAISIHQKSLESAHPNRKKKMQTTLEQIAPIIVLTVAAVGWIFVAFEKHINANLRKKLKRAEEEAHALRYVCPTYHAKTTLHA